MNVYEATERTNRKIEARKAGATAEEVKKMFSAPDAKRRLKTKKTQDKAAPVGVISSEQGQDFLKQLQGIEQTITGIRESDQFKDQAEIARIKKESPGVSDAEARYVASMGGEKKEQPAPQASAVVMNPDTEQTKTFEGDPETVRAQVEAAAQENFQVVESSESGLTTPENPEIAKLEAELANATAEVESMMEKMMSYFTPDSDVKSIVDGISAGWNSRIREQKRLNEARKQQLVTLGMRQGAQFSGGTGGTLGFGALVSQAEHEGLRKIGQLNAEKEQAIAEAKAASKENNLRVYAQLVDYAQSRESMKAEALADLKEAQAAKDEEIAENNRQMALQDTISRNLAAGVTDLNGLFDALNRDEDGNITGDYTFAEIQAIKDVIDPPMDLSDLSSTYADFITAKDRGDFTGTWQQYQQMMENIKASGKGSGKKEDRIFKFNSKDIPKLISLGLSGTEIDQLESDLNQYSPEVVFDGLESAMDEEQINQIKNLLSTSGEDLVTEAQINAYKSMDAVKNGVGNIPSLQDMVTTSVLKDLVKEAGFSPLPPVTQGDINAYLESTEAQNEWASRAYSRFKEAGLAQ